MASTPARPNQSSPRDFPVTPQASSDMARRLAELSSQLKTERDGRLALRGQVETLRQYNATMSERWVMEREARSNLEKELVAERTAREEQAAQFTEALAKIRGDHEAHQLQLKKQSDDQAEINRMLAERLRDVHAELFGTLQRERSKRRKLEQKMDERDDSSVFLGAPREAILEGIGAAMGGLRALGNVLSGPNGIPNNRPNGLLAPTASSLSSQAPSSERSAAAIEDGRGTSGLLLLPESGTSKDIAKEDFEDEGKNDDDNNEVDNDEGNTMALIQTFSDEDTRMKSPTAPGSPPTLVIEGVSNGVNEEQEMVPQSENNGAAARNSLKESTEETRMLPTPPRAETPEVPAVLQSEDLQLEDCPRTPRVGSQDLVLSNAQPALKSTPSRQKSQPAEENEPATNGTRSTTLTPLLEKRVFFSEAAEVKIIDSNSPTINALFQANTVQQTLTDSNQKFASFSNRSSRSVSMDISSDDEEADINIPSQEATSYKQLVPQEYQRYYSPDSRPVSGTDEVALRDEDGDEDGEEDGEEDESLQVQMDAVDGITPISSPVLYNPYASGSHHRERRERAAVEPVENTASGRGRIIREFDVVIPTTRSRTMCSDDEADGDRPNKRMKSGNDPATAQQVNGNSSVKVTNGIGGDALRKQATVNGAAARTNGVNTPTGKDTGIQVPSLQTPDNVNNSTKQKVVISKALLTRNSASAPPKTLAPATNGKLNENSADSPPKGLSVPSVFNGIPSVDTDLRTSHNLWDFNSAFPIVDNGGNNTTEQIAAEAKPQESTPEAEIGDSPTGIVTNTFFKITNDDKEGDGDEAEEGPVNADRDGIHSKNRAKISIPMKSGYLGNSHLRMDSGLR